MIRCAHPSRGSPPGCLSPLRSGSPGNCTLLRRTATAFTSTGIPADFAVLCQLIAPCRPSMRFLSISSRLSPSLPSPRWLPFASWLQMVVSSFSCSGIPTGDFNPICNVPMLGTHKPVEATASSPLVESTSVAPTPHLLRSARKQTSPLTIETLLSKRVH